MSRFTVLGAGGFIGRHLVAHLRASGHQVLTPARDVSLAGQAHGHLIYAVGLTGDFRQRPLDAVDAHVGLLARVLREASFESFLYLSSTRVYGGLSADQLAQEDMDLPQRPTLDGLYDLSKLLGESMCLAQNHPAVRVVRLSNVYGVGQSPHTFLQMVLAELLREGEVTIGEAAESTKDYVALQDVVGLLPRIAEQGQARIYNLASGMNLSHRELAECLRNLTGGAVHFARGGVCRRFARIDVTRINQEFDWHPRLLLSDISMLLDRAYK